MTSMILTVQVKRADSCYALPSRRAGDAGWDCYAAETLAIAPHTIGKVSLGFSLAMTEDWAALLLPRSGLASRGITLSNSPGLIDASYRGLVQALVTNGSDQVLTVEPGDRLCQLLFVPVPTVQWQEVNTLSASERGQRGFGSTGVKDATHKIEDFASLPDYLRG